MRYIFSFIILTIAISCNQSSSTVPQKKEDPGKDIIKKSGAKGYKAIEYKHKFGNIDTTSGFTVEVAKFDHSGNTILLETYNESEYLKEFDSIEENVFDKDGNIIETKQFDPTRKLKNVTRWEYKDGLNNNMVIYDSNGTITDKYEYKYDKDGKRIETINYNADGSILYKTKYELYPDGSPKRQIQESNDTLYAYRLEIEKKPGMSVTERFNHNNIMTAILTTKFSSDNNIVEQMYEDPRDKKKSKTTYTYSDKKLIAEKISYDHLGEPVSVVKYIYEF
jgi:hypothetical protein